MANMPSMTSLAGIPDTGFPSLRCIPDHLLNFDTSSPFSSQPVSPGLGEEWGYSAPATPHASAFMPTAAEVEWQRDEAEMRQVIEPNDLGGFLDPALR